MLGGDEVTSTDVVKQQIQEAAVKGDSDQATVFDLIKRHKGALEMALPRHLQGDRFARIALTLVRSTPKLAECEPLSFIGALLVAAQLGLEPGPPLGLSWILPYYNKANRQLEAQFQLGYKGIIELYRRSGQYQSIQAREVCENDKFSYRYGLDDELVHEPPLREERGASFAWYAVAKFQNGGHAFVVLSRDQVEARRKRGQDGPAWRTDYDAMARKSAVRALAPWLPLSPELERQLSADGRTFREIGPDLVDPPALESGDGGEGGDDLVEAEIVDADQAAGT